MTIRHSQKAKRWSHNSQGFETISKMPNLYIRITSKTVKKQIKYSEYDGYQIQIFSLFFFCRGSWREKIVKTLPSLHFWAFPVSTFINHFQSVVFQFSLDLNECSSNSDDCHVNAICHNTVGSYTCTCKPGYKGDGRACSPNGKSHNVLQNPRC